MPIYKYRAKKGPEDVVEGFIEAQNQDEAIEKLGQMEYLPMAIEEQDKLPAAQRGDEPHKIQGGVRSREVTIFSRQLASLLKSGVPILEALSVIQEQSENSAMKAILQDIHNAVKDGAEFSSVLRSYPRIFPALYVAMVRTGEDSGALPEALMRIADYRAKQEENISRFRMAMAYPALMAIVGMATVVFMLTFVMPRLMKIFSGMGQDLPLPTQILISISQGVRQWWLPAVIVILFAILIAKKQASTQTGRVSLGLLKLHIPLFGRFALKTELSRFSRTLELLIKNGVPILKAIDIAIPVLENEVIKAQLRASHKALEGGGSFGMSLKQSPLFPKFMSNLIIVGEQSGKLDEALAEIADIYERDTEETIRIMSSLLEPLMILVMGLIVGFIVVAMLLPIFEINVMAR